jgi:hypothetical protein
MAGRLSLNVRITNNMFNTLLGHIPVEIFLGAEAPKQLLGHQTFGLLHLKMFKKSFKLLITAG